MVRNIVIHHWIILILALSAVVLILVRTKELRGLPTLIGLYFLVAVTMFVVTTGKIGTWYSYSLEMLAVSMILIPILAWKLSRLDYVGARMGILVGDRKLSLDTSSLVQLAIPVLLIIQMVGLPSFASWTAPNGHLQDSYEIVLRDLNGTGDVLSEDGYLLYLSGRNFLYEPSYSVNSARYRGLDLSPIIDKIARGGYGLIIQEWDIEEFYNWPIDLQIPSFVPLDIQREFTMPWARSTYEMVDAILENYQLKYHEGRLWVYEPKPK